jgi:hypothetical protein
MRNEKIPLPHRPKTQKKKNQGTLSPRRALPGDTLRAAETPSEQIAFSFYLPESCHLCYGFFHLCQKKEKVVNLGDAIHAGTIQHLLSVL